MPTLLLFECVLVYMAPEASVAIFQWFLEWVNPQPDQAGGRILGSVVYEMFGLGDAFGRVMVNNLKVFIHDHLNLP
jgi:[phosphatase 2A protein]-leucine-carboxy methyltransferase